MVPIKDAIAVAINAACADPFRMQTKYWDLLQNVCHGHKGSSNTCYNFRADIRTIFFQFKKFFLT